ncbi:MAG: hypothetical protein FWB76_00350 [Oscillospiraceae bacterium]|nr:hypothetical protein [Oscillospiraceae bacterium]
MQKILDEQGLRHLLGKLPALALTTVGTPAELPDIATPFAWARDEGQPQPIDFKPGCVEEYAEQHGIDINSDDALLDLLQSPPNLEQILRIRAKSALALPAWDGESWSMPMLLLRGREGLILFMAVPQWSAGSYNFMAQRFSASTLEMTAFVYQGDGWQLADINSGQVLSSASPAMLSINADLVLEMDSAPGFWADVVELAGDLPGLYANAEGWQFIGPSATQAHEVPQPPPPQEPTGAYGALSNWSAFSVPNTLQTLQLNGMLSSGMDAWSGMLRPHQTGTFLLNFSAGLFHTGANAVTFQYRITFNGSPTGALHNVTVPPNQHVRVSLSELLHVHSCCQVSLQVAAAGAVIIERGATLSLVRVDGAPTGSSGFAAALAGNATIYSIKQIKENFHATHQTLS